MSQKPTIVLAPDGKTITVERVELLPSGALKVEDDGQVYFLAPSRWWRFDLDPQRSAYEDHGITMI